LSKSKLTYADKSEIINRELQKRSHKWFLDSVTWMDYEDVCQIIRIHISNKWDQWDQSRPLEPWLNKIISNQIKNILRNNYGNYVRPCLNCPFNYDISTNDELSGLCSFTSNKIQSSECPLYEKWEKKKKDAYNTKMVLTIENHQKEASILPEETFSELDESIKRINKYMKEVLTEKQYKAYDMLCIKNMTDQQVAEQLGFKTSEQGKSAGYKQIRNLKKMFKEKVQKIIRTQDIIINDDGNRTY